LAQNAFSAVSPLMYLQPCSRQRELIALARRLARERFAPRADRHDRDASFPFDDYADLRTEGLLGLCVPERYGGLGADYETYCLVAEQLAQGNASTALTFNMHCLTMPMMGPIADNMAMPPAVRQRHEKLRAAKFREVVQEGAFYGQPHSEPVEQGETDAKLGVGGRRFGTTARKVDGGYVVNGRKFFVSLAGCAPYYATPAIRLGGRALDRAHLVSPYFQGHTGCVLPRRLGSDGHARHSQSRHVARQRVCRRRRGGAAAWPVRGDVQRLPASLPELLRDLPRAHASGV
jgi:alkylation response protein AidB-like acyl-CoA dehydrogenase